jgi:trehalose 6-phosphate synthase/phosphatase
MNNLIVVSNRLPIKISGETFEKSSGGLVAAIEGAGKDFDLKWIGWPGGAIGDPERRAGISRELDERFNYIPVFLSETEAENYYSGFSNSSLWPLLHYMVTHTRYDEVWYEHYRDVNYRFADTVTEIAGTNDLVWVQDYHLMLLPAMLRERRPDLRIGFFLHTPFPSYEIFRCHPNREEILQGLMGADLIGFHTFSYLRHFRSTVLRILGLESEMTHISHSGGKTDIGVYPIGIHSEKFSETMKSDAFHHCLQDLKETYRDKKVVLGVERLDYTKGLPRRLDAIERFLQHRGVSDDIVFIFVSVPSRESVPEYQKLAEAVQGKVSRINGKFSTIRNSPIHFIFQSVKFSELCALYALADVCMVTPLIDGMNLVAKEYVACQRESPGVLILSEFAGAAQELSNALIVNPYNIHQMVEALREAFELPAEEKNRMIGPMQDRVNKFDARFWARSFFQDLTVEPSSRKDRRRERLQFIEKEGIENVVEPLQRAGQLGFFLDYDGTLAEIRRKPHQARPGGEIKRLLERLESNDRIDVYMISGRKKEDLERWFSDYDIHLIAEHGFFYRQRGGHWSEFDERADLSWMPEMEQILRSHVDSTPGSSLEKKTSALVWHYRESDPEYGSWKAREMVAQLTDMLSNLPVEIHHGRRIVEVTAMQINKGAVVEYFLNRCGYEAALCAGDDTTDERMFRIKDRRIVSIKVGEGDSAAQFRVSTPPNFRRVLSDILSRL